jgi:hypothetical protein
MFLGTIEEVANLSTLDGSMNQPANLIVRVCGSEPEIRLNQNNPLGSA